MWNNNHRGWSRGRAGYNSYRQNAGGRNRYNTNYQRNRYQYGGSNSSDASQVNAPRFRRDNQEHYRDHSTAQTQSTAPLKQENVIKSSQNKPLGFDSTEIYDIDDKLERKKDENNSWVLVFRQTYYGDHRVWPTNTIKLNENDPSSTNYAILHRLEEFRNEQDGKLEFALIWPNSAKNRKYQHWKQTSNPTHKSSTGNVIGYEAIDINYTENEWHGLELTGEHSHHRGSDCLINGSTKSDYLWFYAIGTYRAYKRGIPGPWGPENVTELWVSENVFDCRGEAILKFFLENLAIPETEAKGWLSNKMDQYLYDTIVYSSQIRVSCDSIAKRN